MPEPIQAVGKMRSTGQVGLTDSATAAKATPGGSAVPFSQVLGRALENLNQTAQRSDALAEAYASGLDVELHDVMIAMQEAQMAFDLATQVRSRLVEAYQEIMRMQV